jgi:CRP-like cAMP-binding protein
MANPTMQDRLGQFRIFRDFTPDQLSLFAEFFEEQTFGRSQKIYEQGAPPTHFYLVERGSVELVGHSKDGKLFLRRHVSAGDFFGHRALLQGAPHQTTATAQSDTMLLALDAARFHSLLKVQPSLKEDVRRIHIINRLLATPLFAQFSREQLLFVADSARRFEFAAGSIIFRQNDPSDGFYVIDRGQVKEDVAGVAANGQIWPKYLTAGNFFGRRGIDQQAPRRSTAMALTDVHLFRFDYEAFRSLCQIQPDFRYALERPDVLSLLKSVALFSQLDANELRGLAGFVGMVHIPAGEILYHQGDVDPTLYVLYQGEAVVRLRDKQGRNRPQQVLHPKDAVGQSALMLLEPRDATIQAVADSNWLYLTRADWDRYRTQWPTAANKLKPKRKIEALQRIRRFRWMDYDELILLRTRRHWLFLVNKLLAPSLFAVAMLILLIVGLPAPIATIGWVLASAVGLWKLIDWTNDYYIVTNKRVAYREKVLAIRESRDETPISKIQNMIIDQSWWGNTFGFGTLTLDTAAAQQVKRVKFDYVTDPEAVQELVFGLVQRVKAAEELETHGTILTQLESRLGTVIRPVMAKPAVVSVEDLAADGTAQPNLWTRFAEATYRRWFWIQKRTDGRVTWRKHWIRFLAKTWKPGLLSCFLLLLIALIVHLGNGANAGVLALLSLLLLLSLGWLWWSWEDWGNDQYILTYDRIIDTERLPLGFRSKRTETTFDRIQNARVNVPNPVATLLNYGTVEIFTAGAEGKLDFQYVPNPRDVQAEIFRRLAAYEAQERHKQIERQWRDLPEWFSMYEDIRDTRP